MRGFRTVPIELLKSSAARPAGWVLAGLPINRPLFFGF
eukprot:COSAG06_NODE_45333_length_355_cov_2.152344_1_plen_37_part_10